MEIRYQKHNITSYTSEVGLNKYITIIEQIYKIQVLYNW